MGDSAEGINLSGSKPEVKKARRTLNRKFYRKSSEDGVFECTKCERKYASVKQIFRHYETEHNQKRYKCDVCNEAVFKYPEGLCVHKRKCRGKGEQKFSCNLCSEAFSLKIRLSAHLSQVHEIVPEKRFTCEICGKIFRRAGSLKEHTDVVYNGKRFCCKFCGKSHLSRGSVHHHEKACAKKEPKINLIHHG